MSDFLLGACAALPWALWWGDRCARKAPGAMLVVISDMAAEVLDKRKLIGAGPQIECRKTLRVKGEKLVIAVRSDGEPA